jgi:hypothetical protein
MTIITGLGIEVSAEVACVPPCVPECMRCNGSSEGTDD